MKIIINIFAVAQILFQKISKARGTKHAFLKSFKKFHSFSVHDNINNFSGRGKFTTFNLVCNKEKYLQEFA